MFPSVFMKTTLQNYKLDFSNKNFTNSDFGGLKFKILMKILFLKAPKAFYFPSDPVQYSPFGSPWDV